MENFMVRESIIGKMEMSILGTLVMDISMDMANGNRVSRKAKFI